MSRIAIVGMACRYPDATSPQELWENVVAGRRAFRRLPDERMRLEDYWAEDPATPDRFYARNAAVIEGYEFDRVKFKVAGSTYRSTDLTHWLALDVAAQALADAGFPNAEGLARERTAAVVGNTLTGEFTRANVMRLRWPYVRRMVAGALKEQGWDDDQLTQFLDEFEQSYKSPFPAVDEDTLAGGLSNTIAGRICNHFDLKGGGYTVDGACSSSLLSVVTAAKAIIDGDADIAIAGGVDLSIDPFEIIGFAKTGALARREMRVYDRGSNGFWPGEGCGMVVLMREDEALAAGHRVYASIAGWGISSDGKGSITRPEVSGYQLALYRAYERAGFGIETVPVFEGHGTGTEVGDANELNALSLARRTADPDAPAAAISSIKAMIGHTKAAAGIAGLIKAAMAMHHEVVPPTTGCVDPHPVLTGDRPALRAVRKAEAWPEGAPVRAGVTAMGFGGINTHVVLDGARSRKADQLDARAGELAASVQDVELLLVEADSAAQLRDRLAELIGLVSRLAYAQLADLGAVLERDLAGRAYRAAVVVSSPDDAERKLRKLLETVEAGGTHLIDPIGGLFLGHADRPARIGFLFPGQGSGRGVSGGALRRRFRQAEEVYERAALPTGVDVVATTVAQPRIVTGSMAGLKVLDALGLTADVAVGHSLGEISALYWAGAMDEQTLLRVATVRGATMAENSASGTMAGIGAGEEATSRLIADEPVVIAGYNGPQQTVVAGPVDAVQRICRAAGDAGLSWARLPVSHAFHSPLVAPAAAAFAARLSGVDFGPLCRRIISTVTGGPLDEGLDVVRLLEQQITKPVQFATALAAAATEVDLFIEVGPGRVLSGMARELSPVPAVAMNTDDESLASTMGVIGAAYVTGATLAREALFGGRFTRPLDLGGEFSFFASPCEAAPRITVTSRPRNASPVQEQQPETAARPTSQANGLELLRRLAAERAELPPETVADDSRLLDDLHLSSITVGQLVGQAARELGLPAAQTPTNFASATLRELADALDELVRTGGEQQSAPTTASGVGPWARPFVVELVGEPLSSGVGTEENGTWQVFAQPGHPFAEELGRSLERAAVGAGVLLCLTEDCPQEHLEMALSAAQAAVSQPEGGRLVLVQHGHGAAGMVKTARLEAPRLRTTVVDLPPSLDPLDLVVAEVAATTGFVEVNYDEYGVRRVPVLRPLPEAPPARTRPPLDHTDVLLVTGGGKGITAECALAVAADTGARLAILGRSDPAADTELAANLARMGEKAAAVHYVRADVTDRAAVRAAVAEVSQELGPVTAVLHGAGRNEPAALTDLGPEALRQTFDPKINGLRVVLDAVDPDTLRLLVTFGSIIGRAGLRGEAHYATANEWLAQLTSRHGETHPHCRTLCLEWSVWSGVGMGERLSVVESLMRDGVTAITPDQGVGVLRRLLADPQAPGTVVVTGRADNLDTIRYDRPELPLLRFTERPLVHYPGVELVTEVELSPRSDLYLDDHRLDDNLLFPAVLGMEAMAQVASALGGYTTVPVIDRVEFARPIVVPPDGATTIQVAALVTGEKTVDVAIRSVETGYAADHFRATLRFDSTPAPSGEPEPTPGSPSPLPLEPSQELYGDTLFQGKRFQRLQRYRRVAARFAEADVCTSDAAAWFSTFLPGQLVLGDPGARDAFMHGIQVCVPDATLLPAGVERIYVAGPKTTAAGDLAAEDLAFVASERENVGDTYVYDVAVRNSAGDVVERWVGLRLQAVRKKDGRGPWAPVLLGPFLQRNLEDVLGADIAVAVEPRRSGVRPQAPTTTETLAGRALGYPVRVVYRPDGRPELQGGRSVSASHGASLDLVVVGTGTLSCDVEQVVPRSTIDWADLLGNHGRLTDLIVAERGDPYDVAATRVWCAIECVQKAGRSLGGPLTLEPRKRDGWVVMSAGDLRIATFLTSLRDADRPVVFAVLTERRG
ncbi:type I polyketide synthase [Micromonospora sp. SL1-18]|uniref:type I polyketide synthase n=1 Tax=Micromonospora sp. SL1-18 TaxID=3399128 RepID=UPI003A4E32B8